MENYARLLNIWALNDISQTYVFKLSVSELTFSNLVREVTTTYYFVTRIEITSYIEEYTNVNM